MLAVVELLLAEPEAEASPDACVAPVDDEPDAPSALAALDVADVVVGATVELSPSVAAACWFNNTVITSLLTAPELADPDEPLKDDTVEAAVVLSGTDAVGNVSLLVLAAAAACFSRLARSTLLVVLPPTLDMDIS